MQEIFSALDDRNAGIFGLSYYVAYFILLLVAFNKLTAFKM